MLPRAERAYVQRFDGDVPGNPSGWPATPCAARNPPGRRTSNGRVTSWSRNSKLELPSRCSIFAGRAGQEIIQRNHRVAFRQQPVAHVRPDKPGRAGNHNSQRFSMEALILPDSVPESLANRLMLQSNKRCHGAPNPPGSHHPVAALSRRAGCSGGVSGLSPDHSRARATSPAFHCNHSGRGSAISLGSDAAGQGDPGPAAARHRARLRVLGFLAFALVTINHLAEGFGVRADFARDAHRPGLFRLRGAVCRRWWRFPSLGLFVRRFFVRPKWLGKVSPESGFIAFLIFS